ncbi:MAG: type II secretion system protein GspL [Pseudomonadota bacterium]
MTTLYIRHPAKADGEGALCQFALVADGGALVQQGSGLPGGLGDIVAASRRVVLLLAATDVTLLHVKVPPLSNARLKAALPSLVEDHILGDPLDCVLVAAPAQHENGMRTIAVAQRSWLEAIVKQLLAQGARAIALQPAQLCLPIVPGNVSAALGPHDITLRQAQYEGIGLALDAPPGAMLQTVRALAGEAPLTLYVAAAQLDAYQALATPGMTLEADHWAHWIAGAHSTTFDLLAGLGAAGAHPRNWKRWRWPLRLALLAALVNIVALNVEWMRLRREADATRASMLQTYKATYPKDTVILDPAAQMRKNIALAKAGSGQLGADELTYLAAAFGEAAGALGRKPVITAMDYRERALDIKYKPDSVDPGALDQLKGTLNVRHIAISEPAAGTWHIDGTGGKK